VAQSWGYRRAGSERADLLVAIVAVLAAGIIAAILIPVVPGDRASRENGSLLAPPSDEGFTAALGAPGAPSSSIGADAASAQPGAERPAPTPRKPPSSPGAPPPPPDEGLLGLLDDLPIVPPPPPVLPGVAAARAMERIAAVR
jgi:hypothetical protein